MLVTRARDTSSYFAFCNLVGGQDELVFDGHSVVLDDAGEVVARAPGFEEHLLVVDVEPTSPSAAGCATFAGASSTAPARAFRQSTSSSSPRFVAREAARPRGRRRSSPSSSRCAARSSSGCATTSRRAGSSTSSSGVSGGIDSAVTAALCVDAFGAGPRPLRLDAVAVLVGRHADGRSEARREPRLRASARSRSRTSSRRSASALARADGRPRRARRGEPAGASPRSHPHGALEHVRLAGRLDGEQVGARGRLLDPLRGHGRRVRAPQGRLQDRRLPARAPPERARRHAS